MGRQKKKTVSVALDSVGCSFALSVLKKVVGAKRNCDKRVETPAVCSKGDCCYVTPYQTKEKKNTPSNVKLAPVCLGGKLIPCGQVC